MLARATLTLTLFLCLLAPSVAQTWFTPPKKSESQVRMLRDLFRQPVSTWKATLATHEELLDEQFVENVSRRISWGIENNHIDDALRFAMVGDMVLELRGGEPYMRTLVWGRMYPPIQTIDPSVVVSFPLRRDAERAKALKQRLLRDLIGKTAESALKSVSPEEGQADPR